MRARLPSPGLRVEELLFTVFENRHPDGDFGGQTTEERHPALKERQRRS